jgi:transcriptional regulator with XRE-family HTH domain
VALGVVKLDGAKLRRLREDQGLLLIDLARAASVTKGYLSKIETGRAGDVSPPVAARLAFVLDLAIGELRLRSTNDSA